MNKGEFVVILGPSSAKVVADIDPLLAEQMSDLLDYLTNNSAVSEDFGVRVVGERFDVPTAVARKAIKKHRILVKQQKSADK